MTENETPDRRWNINLDGCGCVMLILAFAIAVVLVEWAQQGFPGLQ